MSQCRSYVVNPALTYAFSSVCQNPLENTQRRYICGSRLIPSPLQHSELTHNMVDILAKGKACLPCRARKSVRGFCYHLTVLIPRVFAFRNATVPGHRVADALRISVLANIGRDPRRWTSLKLKLLASPIDFASLRCEESSRALLLSPSASTTFLRAGGRRTSPPRS